MNLALTVSANERRRSAEVDGLFRERAVPSLIERLSDPSWSVRRAVISALARLGDDAVVPLCDVLLSHRDNESRIAAAVDALAASEGDVEPNVLALLESTEPAVVCDGAQVLGRRRSVAALPRLSELTTAVDDNVAMAAIEAIGRVGGDAAIDLLIAAARSDNFFRAFPAIDVLGRTGDPRAVAPLAEHLTNPRYTIEAARALGSTGQPLALPPLGALLVHPNDAYVRAAGAAVIAIANEYTARFGPNNVLLHGLAAVDVPVANRRMSHALLGADSAERMALCRVLGLLGAGEAVPSLLELLEGDPATVESAALALAALPKEAEPFLLAALRDSSSERRLFLLPIVGRKPAARSVVLSCLADESPGVRALACDALGKLGDPAAVAPLFELLRDTDARVSQAAVAAIQVVGGQESEKLALRAAAASDPGERRSALRILAYFGWPSALDLFLRGMDDTDERMRDLAAIGLAAIDDDRSRQALMVATAHSAPRTRAAAIRALGYIRLDDSVRDRLREALRDEDAWARYYACQALSRLMDEASAPAIASLLGDPAGHVRVAVIEALAHLRGEHALDALHAASQSADVDVRRAALLGLGSVKSPASLPFVQANMDSKDAATRLVALSALAEFDGKSVLTAMASALVDSDEGVRWAAVALLAARPGPEATQVLIRHVGGPGLRDRVVTALSQPIQGRVEAILVALQTAGADLAPMLASVLARTRGPVAVAALEDALLFDNVFARRAAVPALAALGSPSWRKLLGALAIHDPDTQIRRVAAAYLGSG